MAWKTLTTHNFDAYFTASSKATKLNITVQYDDSQDLATTLKIRFVAAADTASRYYYHGFWLYYNPQSNGKGTMKRLKSPNSNWPTSGYPTFTITKAYSASGFSIPKFWVCCTGYPQEPYKSDDDKWYIKFGDLGVQTCWKYFHTADWFDGSRQNYKIEVAARTETKKAIDVANNSAGTCTITDNGDNTFTLNGTKGAAGANNTTTGPTLKWGYNTSYSSSFKNGDIVKLTLDGTKKERTVYAKSVTGSKYGDDKTKTASLAIKQYIAPSKAGKPAISWTRSRMTIKENWTISWGAATATNASSPVAGYRIRVFVNGSSIPIKNNSGTVLTSDTGVNDGWRYYYDRDGTSTSMTFYVGKNSIKPKDKIQVCIHAYTKNGKGTKLYGEANTSSEYTVRYAGVMKVKVSNAWKEGQVYVKVNGAWKEAEVVHTKVSNSWKETG